MVSTLASSGSNDISSLRKDISAQIEAQRLGRYDLNPASKQALQEFREIEKPIVCFLFWFELDENIDITFKRRRFSNKRSKEREPPNPQRTDCDLG